MSLLKNKKAIELSLQTVVILIISIIVLIIIIYFFGTHYTDGSDNVINISTNIFNDVRN